MRGLHLSSRNYQLEWFLAAYSVRPEHALRRAAVPLAT